MLILGIFRLKKGLTLRKQLASLRWKLISAICVQYLVLSVHDPQLITIGESRNVVMIDW